MTNYQKDSLGTRMKSYEKCYDRSLTPRSCAILRTDGRAFHTFTKPYSRPFDQYLMSAMVVGAKAVAEEISGFKAAFIQSDEASFLITDYDDLNTQSCFNYRQSKLETIAASTMTAYFMSHLISLKKLLGKKLPVFDARAFVIPKDDVSNYFLWRSRDWKRNSLNMYARQFFSAKQMHGKRADDVHEMLHGIGKNWATDLSDMTKNGTFLINAENDIEVRHDILPIYLSISSVIEPLVYKNQRMFSPTDTKCEASVSKFSV